MTTLLKPGVSRDPDQVFTPQRCLEGADGDKSDPVNDSQT